MQQALGAGIRLAVPPEFSLTPRGVPSVGEEPTATEDAAFESRFDVRRERDVLREECGWREPTRAPRGGTRPVARTGSYKTLARTTGTGTGTGTPPLWTRPCVASRASPTRPRSISTNARGYPRDAATFAVAMWGDDESKVVDFCEGFARGTEMGLDGPTLAGALAACDNDVERAVASCVR